MLDLLGRTIDPRLIIAHERGALRLAAIARLIVSLVLLLAFVLLRPPGLPTSYAVLIVLTAAVGIVFAGFALWLARQSFFRPWHTMPFTLLDILLYAALLLGTHRLIGLPVDLFASVPPFLLIFVLLVLGALRLTPHALLVTLAGGLAVCVGMIVYQLAHPAPGERLTIPAGPFAVGANIARVAMVAAAGALLIVLAQRTRNLLQAMLGEIERNHNLCRFLPKPVAQRMTSGGDSIIGPGQTREVALMFADIVGFTGLSEGMPPQEVGQFLGEMRSLQRDVIESGGGVVDKFVGDEVFAVFGVPDADPQAAARALAAAFVLERRSAIWNAERRRSGRPPVEIGIGLHYGEAFIGVIGDEHRLELATLGDAVNVAQRVEKLTRGHSRRLLVTRALLNAAGENLDDWQALPAEALKGRDGLIEIFAPRRPMAPI